jgi:GT2 family glycosyltransferase
MDPSSAGTGSMIPTALGSSLEDSRPRTIPPVSLTAPQPTAPLVAVVVVTYNNITDTRDCLNTVLRLQYPRVHIIVVDNGSEPAEAEGLRAEFGPHVDVIRVSANHGYAPGANAGIRRALGEGADLIWLLNNDAQVSPTSLTALVAEAGADPSAGLLGPLITSPIGHEAPEGIWYAGGTIDLARAETQHVHAEPVDDTAFPTSYMTGCAVLVRASTLREIGLLRDDYYLYWEDADLGLRAQAAGWRLVVVPTARVTHALHGSIPSTVARRFYTRNGLWTAATHGDGRTLLQAGVTVGWRVGRAWIAALARHRPTPWPESIGYLEGIVGALSARNRSRHMHR